MIVKNPTDKQIEVRIYGENYVLPANGQIDNISEKAAQYWKEHLHEFIVVKDYIEAAKDKEEKTVEKVKKTVKKED